MKNLRQVAVVGVTGYTGLELARILLRHPSFRRRFLRPRTKRCEMSRRALSPIPRLGEAPLRPLSVDAIISSGAGSAFWRLRMRFPRNWRRFAPRGLRVVDLSGAFRFHEAETFTSWYKLAAPTLNGLRKLSMVFRSFIRAKLPRLDWLRIPAVMPPV